MEERFFGKWKLRGRGYYRLESYRTDENLLLLRSHANESTAERITVLAEDDTIYLRSERGSYIRPHSVSRYVNTGNPLGCREGDEPFLFHFKILKDGRLALMTPWRDDRWECWGISLGGAMEPDALVSSVAMGRSYPADRDIEETIARLDRIGLNVIAPPLATILAEKELPGVDLDGVDLSGADLSAKNFRGTTFIGANLEGVDFTGSDLSDADFSRTVLRHTNLRGANLEGTRFVESDVRQASFGESPRFSRDPSHRTDFTRAKVSLQNFPNGWSYLNLNLADIAELAPGVDLSGLNAEQAVLTGLDLSGAVLREARFSGAVLNGVSWSRIIASGARFDRADMTGCNLTSADLTGARLDGATLGSTDAELNSDLTDADLSQAVLREAHLFGVSFAHCLLLEADLSGADADRADFAQAYLTRAKLNGARLRGTIFAGACMLDADLRGAELGPSGQVRTSFAGACLQGVRFDGAVLNGVSLKGTALAEAPGKFPVTLPGAHGPQQIEHGATSLPPELTSSENICPNGSHGPCGEKSWPNDDAPRSWRYTRALRLSKR